MSHVHKEIEGLRLKKRWRLLGRFTVAIILICLPLAESLDSLELVGTITALIVFCLVLEMWACSSCNDSLCWRSSPCKYTGHCGKKELEALVKDGKEAYDLDAIAVWVLLHEVPSIAVPEIWHHYERAFIKDVGAQKF